MNSEEAWLYGQLEPGENRPLQGDPVHIDRVLKRIQGYSSSNNKMESISTELQFKHTKGEWVASGLEVGTFPGLEIKTAKVTGFTYEEAKANALLIAAAPEMLKVLMLFVERQERGWHINLGWNQEDTRDKIKAVIEKAVGNV